MKWHPNSRKHKAMHCGYKGKPTKGQVNALLDMYKQTDLKIIEQKQLDLFV